MARNQCPHCSCFYYYEEDQNPDFTDVAPVKHASIALGRDGEDNLYLRKNVCVNCGKMALSLFAVMADGGGWADPLYPYPSIYRPPTVPSGVPDEFAEVYVDAWTIIGDSPRASATLSRFCLEHILVEKSGVPGVTGWNLKRDIEKVVQSNTLPRSISELLDAPRLLGKIAAHPKKHSETGLVLPVDVSEAIFCLEIIVALFEHYFVTPDKNSVRLKGLIDKVDQSTDHRNH